PIGGTRRPIPDLRDAMRVDGELISSGSLGTQGTAVDRAIGVAFDIDNLAVADTDELAAADGAVRADAGHFVRMGKLETAAFELGGPQVEAQAQEITEGEAASGNAQELPAIQTGGGGHGWVSLVVESGGLLSL